VAVGTIVDEAPAAELPVDGGATVAVVPVVGLPVIADCITVPRKMLEVVAVDIVVVAAPAGNTPIVVGNATVGKRLTAVVLP